MKVNHEIVLDVKRRPSWRLVRSKYVRGWTKINFLDSSIDRRKIIRNKVNVDNLTKDDA